MTAGNEMGWRGSGVPCCCDRCDHFEVECHDCCFCVCRSICVTLDTGSGGSASQCGCDDVRQKTDWDCNTNTYRNTIKCGSISVDYIISFRKLADGKCYVCLDSSCFRSESAESVSTQEQCIVLGDPADTKCSKLGGDGTASWSFDLAECEADQSCAVGSAGMGVTLSIECINYVSIDGFGCDAECSNCECVCECLCITYTGGDCTESRIPEIQTCWDKTAKHWQVTFECDSSAGDNQTLTITVDPDSAGACSLLLEATKGEVEDPRQPMSCPDIDATWTIRFDDGSVATVTISCSYCGECVGSIFCESCPGVFIPRVLTATIEDVLGGCSNLAGLQFTLVNPGSEIDFDCWQGTPTDVAGCNGGGPCSVKLSMRCQGDGSFIMPSGSTDCDPSEADDVKTSDPISCDPFEILFENILMVCCCPGATTVDIRVTE